MIDFIKDNWTGLVMFAVMIMIVVALAVLGGCSIDELITVDTPPKMQDAIGVAPTITLAEYEYAQQEFAVYVENQLDTMDSERERFVEDVRLVNRRFDTSVSRGLEAKALVGMLVNDGTSMATGYLQTIPGGAIAAGALGTLAGLFMRKPGTYKEKIDSYNAGRRDALEAVEKSTKIKE